MRLGSESIVRLSRKAENGDRLLFAKRYALQSLRPTFLGIGSMRCGSTWLYEVLKCHPDVQMSSAKEMDFFFMPQMLQYDFDWYTAHFKPANGDEPKAIRGEISPRYARLKPWHVRQIAKLMPDLRIILTVRHPIERVWSQTLFDFGRLQRRDVRKVTLLEFLRQLERPRSRLSSNYSRTIRIWSATFGKDAVYVGLFDELRDHPEDYVNAVLRHIGAAAPWMPPATYVGKKILATKNMVDHEPEIPELVRWYIADQLLKETEELNHLLDGRVAAWVDEMRAIRGRRRLSWQILRELNRTILSVPEGLAYNAYHLALDLRLWRRWRRLRTTHLQ
jgi:Sulfotransferase family